MQKISAIAAVLMASTAGAAAQSGSLMLDDRIQALAMMAVHEKTCSITIEETALARFMAENFENGSSAAAALEANINMMRFSGETLEGADKAIRCAAIRNFGYRNQILKQ